MIIKYYYSYFYYYYYCTNTNNNNYNINNNNNNNNDINNTGLFHIKNYCNQYSYIYVRYVHDLYTSQHIHSTINFTTCTKYV